MICPHCGFTSSEEFETCPQCTRSALGDNRCGNCGSPLDLEIDRYCQVCGAVNQSRASEESIVCDTHIDNRAVGFCVVCGKAVCEDCLETYGNRLLCDDPKHRIILDEWRVIFSFDFEYEAAMLYANLEQHGIESEVFSKPNPDTSDSPVRPTIVEVLVPKTKFGEAKEIAEMLGLFDDDISEGNPDGDET